MSKKDFKNLCNRAGIDCHYSGNEKTMYLAGTEKYYLENFIKRVSQGERPNFNIKID